MLTYVLSVKLTALSFPITGVPGSFGEEHARTYQLEC